VVGVGEFRGELFGLNQAVSRLHAYESADNSTNPAA
jgi:hypothetical protein